MILVADASALIALAACDSLTLLDALFGSVMVPNAVFSEVTVGERPQAQRLRHYLQDKVRDVDMQGQTQGLDSGRCSALGAYRSESGVCQRATYPERARNGR